MIVTFPLSQGGAGVGKSFLIEVLYQTLNRYYAHLPGNQPEFQKVLLTAPTGRAAHNIGGLTLHSAFDLPLNQYRGKQLTIVSFLIVDDCLLFVVGHRSSSGNGCECQE